MTARKLKKSFDSHRLDNLGVSIKHLVSDSRQIVPGDTFLAYVGEKFDARKFIPQAIAAGANAVLWEKQNFSWDPAWKLPALPVTGLKEAAGFIASHVYGNPSRKLWLIGITGTNGKTSCSHWIAQAMAALNNKTAIIGTLGNGFPDKLESTTNTTPDAVLLQQEMVMFLNQGADAVAMEVSSHGIEQGRINGSTFAVAVLTNLSRDHLDYHGSMDAYATAKEKLFFWPGLKHAVLNLDDVFGVEISRQLVNKETQVIGYGFRQPEVDSRSSESIRTVRGSNLKITIQGLGFDVEFEGNQAQVKAGLMGRFNASNLLAVLATLLISGYKFSDAVEAIQQVRPLPGRMEKFGGEALPVVIVDYAHTPDALEKVLITLREILRDSPDKPGAETKNARLFCVFGCGGERDSGKRRISGEVVTRLADKAIITNDNPRSEKPREIIDEIVAGAESRKNFSIEEDRGAAIYRAICDARKGDIVLIAGKGHESYQEMDGNKLPFSDCGVVQQVLQQLSTKARKQG
ncbi:MAG: UDP-N-acetylmuramoyl-L-alanyl-D-glutamate--2,6-diaminopimelate ligase [Nitrosomonas sp.]|nr:UDP-N-acetylmuramoyl-L-alanyl-D-glutamate--2,6-diaminopimelate ligase [Nitrosomonas sp.]MDP1949633.1 UDP-N-acetylmuramoyl-L-alanyl-D-glutamate--2,6-diaminopimelate ligase [Nitrosomonas sp.]